MSYREDPKAFIFAVAITISASLLIINIAFSVFRHFWR